MENNSRFSRRNENNALRRSSHRRAYLEAYMRRIIRNNGEKTKIELITNYFPIEVSKELIYHYDIDILKLRGGNNDDDGDRNTRSHNKYKCLNTKVKRNVVETMVATRLEGIRPAFDGEKNLYTNKPLPRVLETPFNVTLDENGRSVNYEINLKPVRKDNVGSLAKNTISFEPLNQLIDRSNKDVTEEIQTAITALETILRHGPAQHLIPIGRSFYAKPHENSCHISGGLEIWFGHYQCVQLTKRKLMLNIDCSATTFYRNCSVIDFMLEVLYPNSRDKEQTLRQIRRLTPAQQNTLLKQLKNVNIQVTHLQHRRKHRITGITSDSASETFFKKEIDGRETTLSVSDYFRTQYEELKYPNLPCLDVGRKDRTCHLPMEVCEIVEGQHYNKKLSERQASELFQFTAQPPGEKFQEIQNLLEVVLQDFGIFSREFGIHINSYPVHLTANILNPPIITYSANRVQPSNGRWNMRGQKFLEGVNVESWMILNFSPPQNCNRNILENFATMLINEGRNVGLTFFHPPVIKTDIGNNDPGNIIREEKETHPNLQLIVIVLPTETSQNIYCEVKTVAETDLGIMTQCVKDINISGRKCTPQLVCNICQKINAKMGGVNNSLIVQESLEGIMIIGADCCHPFPDEDNQYSVAALVGNLDHFSGRYKASVRTQKPAVVNGINSGREIIIDIKKMMKELLIAYRENNRMKPRKIIFYRDGVSEGDFNKLLNYELIQITDAFDELYGRGGNDIPVTFIAVRKRHHTRFNVINRNDGVGRYANIPPGTVINTDIVYPVFGDFFLCSQMTFQGTSQPAHYTVISDDNNFGLDKIQSLTYNLCHTSVRCTASTNVPSPVRYASFAASRVKSYLISKSIEVCNSTDEEYIAVIEESIREAISVDKNMENSMYFV